MKRYFKHILFFTVFVFGLSFNSYIFAEEIIPEVLPIETPVELPSPDDSIPPVPPTEEVVAESDVAQDTYIEENVFIRSGEKIIYDGVVSWPAGETVNIEDSGGVSHEINGQSVLALIDFITKSENPPFTISNLQYYSSYGALYLKCITSAGGEEFCDNWQYVINGSAPSSGIDYATLSGGENVALYFGNPHKLTFSSNEVEVNQPVTVNSLKYNYLTNTWDILTGVNISVTIPNDLNPFNPTVISEIPVDENGQAVISLGDQGTYTIGIKEDFSFPSYQLIISDTQTPGGGSTGNNNTEFSLSQAVSFLLANYGSESFNELLYTDWLAVGIAKAGSQAKSLRDDLIEFYQGEDLDLSSITDYERHAMALMSLGINPYSETDINYIDEIVSSFDGEQIGDDSLYNDDIFGLIVLSNAGYDEEDEIIKKVVSFIISKQSNNGSWGSVDMTAAAIEALTNFKDLDGVSDAISNGQNYLIDEQMSDGGFGNVSSTGWAIQALSLEGSFDGEIDQAIKYLAEKQQSDGGLTDDTNIKNRVWVTSYAIPAVLKLSWSDILESFSKEEDDDENSITNEENQNELENENVLADDQIIPEEKIIIAEIPQEKIKNIESLKPVVKIDQTNEAKNKGVEIAEKNLLGASAYDSVSENQGMRFFGMILEFWVRLWHSFINIFI